MGNSPHFFFDVVTCAVLAIILWAACAGVGSRILPARGPRLDPEPDTDTEVAPASWNQPGIAASVGLGVLMFLGGVGVAIELPWWLLVVPFLAIGLVLVGIDVSRRGVRRPARRSTLVVGAVAAGSLLLVAIIQAVPGLRFPLNLCDDYRAYLPLAHRLLDTGGLADSWNARRLQNLGGFTYLQSMPVAIFGNAGMGVIETVVATVFLGGLFVANGFRTTWARVLSIGFILVIPLLWVPRVNATGVLMGGPLLVAVLAITVELRKALRESDRAAAIRWAVAGGLVIATVTSVRPNLGVLAAAFLALGALLASGPPFAARLQTLGAAAAATIVAIAPWSIASWRTVNTPFFILFTGNQNREAVAHERASDLRDLVDQAWSLMRAGPYLWVTIGVLVVAVVIRKTLPDAPTVIVGAAVTILFIVGFSFVEYFAAGQAVIRYIAPAAEGLAVFLLCETVRSIDAQWSPRSAASSGRSWVAPALAIGAAMVLAAAGYSVLTITAPPTSSGGSFIERAAKNQLKPPKGFEVSTPQLRQAYRRALAGVDADRTIAAVDRPYLIDFDQYDIPNMDLPGFTTPDARFPFFSGPAAKVAYLRRAGYTTLLATVPETEVCLTPLVLRTQVRQNTRAYAASARPYLDWEDNLALIAAQAPRAVKKVGPLLVIDLPRAQRALAAASEGA